MDSPLTVMLRVARLVENAKATDGLVPAPSELTYGSGMQKALTHSSD
jgi:hypothetical protein